MRRSLPGLLAALLLVAAACGTAASEEADPPPPTTAAPVATTAPPITLAPTTLAPTNTTPATPTTAACPVTIPVEGAFSPPEPWPADYPHEGMVWFGSDDLWTTLSLDGDHDPRKSVWWSANFPGGQEEEQPPLDVVWRRLDGDEVHVHDEDATNAYTVEEGWFMMQGIDPDTAGCWEVTATYKGATLSYVYER